MCVIITQYCLFEGFFMNDKIEEILSFEELIHNVRVVENCNKDRTLHILLKLNRIKFEQHLRIESLHGSLQSNELYEKLFKYCSFRDLDANTFFTKKLQKKTIYVA